MADELRRLYKSAVRLSLPAGAHFYDFRDAPVELIKSGVIFGARRKNVHLGLSSVGPENWPKEGFAATNLSGV